MGVSHCGSFGGKPKKETQDSRCSTKTRTKARAETEKKGAAPSFLKRPKKNPAHSKERAGFL